MIKLVIFDLDGVLIDTRELHFITLNKALEEISKEYIISEKEHLSKYDGLPTSKKIDILIKERNFPSDKKKYVCGKKQEYTCEELDKFINDKDYELIELMKSLKENNIKIYVASNSIRKTLETCVNNLGLSDLIDGMLSNEDVLSPKPHPEIYMRCIIQEKVFPYETLIIEDSYIGRTSAILSGATLCPVKNRKEVTKDRIFKYLNIKSNSVKWNDDKLNIVIPMAGKGSRFTNAGYTFPKPLIEVNGKPMIQLVIENLNIDANYIFIVNKEHYDKFNLKTFLNAIAPGCKIITIDEVTEGACCTTLLAEEFINNDNPLLICNSDQYVEWNSGEFYHSINSDGVDGSVLIFENTHPKWSYVKTDDYGNVIELKEKEVISNKATVGIYFWKKGSDYVKYSHQMIDANIRVNNEFYVAPVYNEGIKDGLTFKTFNIKKMWGLGTPEDLNNYLIHNK
jgi:HAD superfamily hydrolase (TIGR01509 family)